MVECLLCKQNVAGSNPTTSTSRFRTQSTHRFDFPIRGGHLASALFVSWRNCLVMSKSWGWKMKLRMTDKTLPLREGECPGGARGYDSVTRHTPPASGHPLYLRGGVCTNRLKLDGDIPEDCKRRSRPALRRDRPRQRQSQRAWSSLGRRLRRRRSASEPSRRRLRRPIRMC